MSLFKELKRRNVFRVGIAYVVGAWLIAQVAELAADSFGAPDWFMKMLLTVLALGLPVALFFAWAFELTPEGIKKEKDVDRSQSITTHTGRKLDFMIIGVLGVALAYFVADKFLGSEPFSHGADQASEGATGEKRALTPAGPRSIAVLPLVNMSSDAENEYFADGLTEELLNMLAKISELQVAGRTSSFAFKGQNEDLRSIAQKLNVDTLLEGSVRKDDARQRVRITLQLINAADGYHLWSETYDRGLDDIFAIQEEVAHEVARAMRVTLLGEDEQRIASHAQTGLSAYELYLQGLQEFNDFSFASLREAERLFGESIALDPNYLPAQLKLASTWIELATTGALSRTQALEKTLPMVEKVLAAEPQNSEAHVLMANAHRLERKDELAAESLQKALHANARNGEALRELGRLLFDQGQVQRGMESLHEAERLDPYSVNLLWDLTFTYAMTQQPERSEDYTRRIGEIQPDNPMQYYGRGFAWQFAGDLPKSMLGNAKAFELDPNDPENPATVAMHWVELGDIEQAEAWSRKADAIAADLALPIVARMQILQYREHYELAANLAGQALESGVDNRAGSDRMLKRAYVSQLVRKGQVEQALAFFRKDYPEAFAQPLQLDARLPYRNVDLAEIAILLKLQDPNSERAVELTGIAEQRQQLLEPAWLPPAQSIGRAVLAMARSDKAAALDELQRAWQQNFRMDWRELEDWHVFAPLHGEPEYRELMALIEADRTVQLERAHELLGAVDG